MYTLSDDMHDRPFYELCYHAVKTMPAGLYIPDANLRSSIVCDDGLARLVLPFRIGANSFARKSDNSRFCNGSSLYELGYPPLGGDPRAQRLVKVFESWTRMVESGEWRIGEDGVAEEVEMFREADTEGNWAKYWIAPSW